MFRRFDIFVKLLVTIGVSVLYGCVTETSSNNNSTKDDTLAYSTPAELDKGEPDEVRVADVINRSKAHVKRTGEIYLMRGLANVFSRRIDDMATQLRSRGYDAANFSYKQWPQVAKDIVLRASRKKVSYPVIIVGHSLGANESSKFANNLASNNVEVGLVVAFLTRWKRGKLARASIRL
ncbi:MAG: hypothetical protein ACR2O3_01240 [Rhizobiaceae bacterium]